TVTCIRTMTATSISTRTTAGSGARRTAGSAPTTGARPMISIASVQAAMMLIGASRIRIGAAPLMRTASVVTAPTAASVVIAANDSAAVPEDGVAAQHGSGETDDHARKAKT